MCELRFSLNPKRKNFCGFDCFEEEVVGYREEEGVLEVRLILDACMTLV